MPIFESDSHKLAQYVKKHKAEKGLWASFDSYIISLLKAYYGEGASKENDFGFEWLPRVTGDHSHFGFWLDMADGKLDGLFVMGQNPGVGAPNARLQRKALANLKWLVVRDTNEMLNLIAQLKPGGEAKMTVLRKSREATFDIKVGKRPASAK